MRRQSGCYGAMAACGETFKSGAVATIAPAHDGTMTCPTPVRQVQTAQHYLGRSCKYGMPRPMCPRPAGHFSSPRSISSRKAFTGRCFQGGKPLPVTQPSYLLPRIRPVPSPNRALHENHAHFVPLPAAPDGLGPRHHGRLQRSKPCARCGRPAGRHRGRQRPARQPAQRHRRARESRQHHQRHQQRRYRRLAR
ncbi:hypothetical protein D3C72_1613330 [compost metagenome]